MIPTVCDWPQCECLYECERDDRRKEFFSEYPNLEIEIMTAHLETVCEVLRAQAVAVGRELEAAKVEGKTMRVIRGLEHAHRAAWLRFYAADNQLHEASNNC